MVDDFIIPEADENTVLNFGIYKGTKIKDAPAGYLLAIYDIDYTKKMHLDVWKHIHKNKKLLEQEAEYEEDEWNQASTEDIY